MTAHDQDHPSLRCRHTHTIRTPRAMSAKGASLRAQTTTMIILIKAFSLIAYLLGGIFFAFLPARSASVATLK